MSIEIRAPSGPETVPLCVPHLGGNEWEYVKDCLDTNWLSTGGPYVDRFEGMMAEYVGAGHAVATSSGTAALHVALLAAGVEPGDEVLASTLTFIATANAIRYIGAWPVFIDADPDYWQMDSEKLNEFLQQECRGSAGARINKSTGRRVKAILPVHLLGHPCDMEPILEAAHRHGLVVIEDATESLGAKYKGRMAGVMGDLGCYSFNGNKLITTGGGGMIVTDDPKLAQRCRHLSTQATEDPVEYIHDEIGYNYRLTNLQAAMGCAQLEKIEEHIAAKRRIARAYRNALHGLPGLRPMGQAPWAESVFWLFTVLVSEQEFGMSSRCLMDRLSHLGIQSRPLFQPCHLSPAHAGCQTYGGEVAERIYREALSLPCSVGLRDEDLERVLDALRSLSPRG